MNLLAFDCAVGGATVAVCRAGAITSRAGAGGPETLLDLIDAAMTQAAIGYADLARIVTTVGPGHFTGLRVGLATARGLAFAHGVATAGYTTFAALAWGVERPDGRQILAAVDSKRAELFFQFHDESRVPIGDPLQCAPEDVDLPDAPLVIAGDPAAARAIAARARDAVASPGGPDAATLIAMARAGVPAMALAPHYVRAVSYALAPARRAAP